MCVNKTNFHMKGFALGLALKQRRNATWKSPIEQSTKRRSHSERFVYSIVQVSRVYDYQTRPTLLFEKFEEVRKGLCAFFLAWLCFRVLIG